MKFIQYRRSKNDLYRKSQASDHGTAEIEGNLTLNEYQDILYREIDLLAMLLGIE